MKRKCAHCRRGRLPAARSASSAATTLVAAPGGGSPASERQEVQYMMTLYTGKPPFPR